MITIRCLIYVAFVSLFVGGAKSTQDGSAIIASTSIRPLCKFTSMAMVVQPQWSTTAVGSGRLNSMMSSIRGRRNVVSSAKHVDKYDYEWAPTTIMSMSTTSSDDKESSFAHVLSSPERFAKSCNLTVEEMERTAQERRNISQTHHDRLVAFGEEKKHIMTASEIGQAKHQMICRHLYQHSRKPFVCTKCWTYLPICVCNLFQKKASLPQGVEKVIVWTHHGEWGRTSNTGSLLPLGLEDTVMLMKGLDEHEDFMQDLFAKEDITPVVLWPGKEGEGDDDVLTVSAPELRRNFLDMKGQSNNCDRPERIVLISIESTWSNARKMVNKLPKNVLRLDLKDEVAAHFTTKPSPLSVSNKSTASPSLLAPLRRQGEGSKRDNVSTVEATVIALLALGLDPEDSSRILDVAQTKVDRLMEYTGKIGHAQAFPSKERKSAEL